MDSKETMRLNLEIEIDKKCDEIKEKRIQERLAWVFIISCGFFIILPVTLIFAGVNPFTILLPVAAYFGLCTLFLCPIIVQNKSYGGYSL